METLLEQIAAATGAENKDAILTTVSDLRRRLSEQEALAQAQSQQIERAQSKIAKHDAAVDTLERETSGRGLSESTRAALIKILSAAPDKVKVLVLASDPEAQSYALQFVAVFAKAGWQAHKQDAMFFSPPVSGLRVQLRLKNPDAQHPAVTIQRSLTAAGIPFRVKVNTTIDPPDAVLQVGHK